MEERLAVPAESAAPDRLAYQLYHDILNEGKLELADEIIAPDAVTHLRHTDPDLPAIGPQHIKQFLPLFCGVFPDAYWTIEEIIAGIDGVAVRISVEGSHLGDYREVPPTGHPFKLTGVELFKVTRGQIVERWSDVSPLGVIQHIDATRYLQLRAEGAPRAAVLPLPGPRAAHVPMAW
jgi:predicted ester cyclase